MNILSKQKSADIGLLLEGTFPFVSGGVSSWVNQIIRGFPQLSFAICFLGSRPEDYGGMRYELPENVVHLDVHYLHAPAASTARPGTRPGDPEVFADIRTLHDRYRCPAHGSAGDLLQALMHFRREGRYDKEDFLHSLESWNFISDQYRLRCTDPSFIDYFWTVRIMHAPLWQLMDIAETFIPVKAFHTISTGYAGFLGALLKRQTGNPLLLSEHGIYTKERKIDLFQAQWIRDNRGVLEKTSVEIAYFRALWIRFFEALGRECYHNADRIVSLYEANRQRQIDDGAPEDKTLSIPNGVDLPRLARLRPSDPAQPPQVVCFIGRVVPIKDVKTFIRAMRTVVNHNPAIQAWIAGPEDEDPAYARDCRLLAEGLGLEKHVRFLGFQKIDTLLPQVGVLVLSSISEALPLVILEGYAVGVPCVATDVGSCRQLIEGSDAEDRALGNAGIVVGIADPQALAGAVLTLLTDAARWRDARRAGIARVERHYTQESMFRRYGVLYTQAITRNARCPVNGHATLERSL
ncbi:MAG TPA: GT4 family glycosyltransferase PelF [Fluviicoccus sp.]|nr:GT4 family glycosyltransferase PelF [Fluviicoccus sp.]